MTDRETDQREKARERDWELRNLAGEIMLRCGVRGMSKEHGELQTWVENKLVDVRDAGLAAGKVEGAAEALACHDCKEYREFLRARALAESQVSGDE